MRPRSSTKGAPMDSFIPDVKNVRRFRPPSLPGRTAVRILILAVAFIFVFTTWFTIDPEEAGIVLRFGRFVRQVPSGLHMKLPYPLEAVLKVPIERQLKEEFGFRTEEAGIR